MRRIAADKAVGTRVRVKNGIRRNAQRDWGKTGQILRVSPVTIGGVWVDFGKDGIRLFFWRELELAEE